jgi:hypothetical protein
MNNYFEIIVEEHKKLSAIGFKKRILAGDNTITPMWTNGMSCLHDNRMKKSGMLWTTGDIIGGMMCMGR